MTITRFGVLGTGRITRRLVADLQSNDAAQVTAIASRTADRARWFADQYGVPTAVSPYADLLRRDDIDAVYIALPPSLHAEWAVAAAEAGKHVLCEKPLATTADQARRIAAACATAGVRWCDATGWVHHQRTHRMMECVGDGTVGDLRHVSAAVSFNSPFQTGEHRLDASLGGGCLLDLGWYAVGLPLLATRRLPRKVFADVVVQSGVPYRAAGMLWFGDGVTASFSCGFDTATRKWFEIAGTAASVICDDFTRPWADKPARFWIHEGTGNVSSESFADAQEQAMIRRLCSDTSLRELQQQSIATHVVLDALIESASRGETVLIDKGLRYDAAPGTAE